MKRRNLISLAVLLGAATLSGCQHYRITDPDTGKTYYTDSWMSGRYYSGAVQFTDAVTGNNVTLMSSELQTMNADEWKREVSIAKGARD